MVYCRGGLLANFSNKKDLVRSTDPVGVLWHSIIDIDLATRFECEVRLQDIVGFWILECLCHLWRAVSMGRYGLCIGTILRCCKLNRRTFISR